MKLLVEVLGLGLAFVLVGVVTRRYLIPSLENIARRYRLPDDVAGATLLAFGSSAPELFTALVALVFAGATPAFGVGSIVGSALFQILVVIGVASLAGPGRLKWQPLLRDGFIYALAVAMLFFFVRDGVFTRLEGALFVGAYLLYLTGLLLWARLLPKGEDSRDGDRGEASVPEKKAPRWKNLLLRPVEWVLRPLPDPKRRPEWTGAVFTLSLVLIALGSWAVVRAGTSLAAGLGVDPTVVALTIVAGGSSAPELFSSVLVARRGQGDMAVANALGSNSFDIFVSLGLPVLLASLMQGEIREVGGANITSSAILLFATLLMVLGLLAAQRFRASRPFGALLVLAYLLYVLAAYCGWIG